MLPQGRDLTRQRGQGDVYVKDSTFKVIRAFDGNKRAISLESVRYPGRFIRHWDSLMCVEPYYEGSSWKNEASWLVVEGLHLTGVRGISLKANNYNGYMRDDGGLIKLEFEASEQFSIDATWHAIPVQCIKL